MEDPDEFAIIYLAIGAELLLKQPLMNQHWSLVFAKPEQATLSNFNSGNFVSVSFSELFKRLEGVCQIRFTSFQIEALNALAARRNALVHFGHTHGVESLQGIASEGIGALLELIDRLCPAESLEPELTKQIQQIRNTAGGVLAVMQSRWSAMKNDWTSSSFAIYRCPECHFNAAQIMASKIKCLFCLYSSTGHKPTEHENFQTPPESCFPEHMVKTGKCSLCNGRQLMITYKDSRSTLCGVTEVCFACAAHSETWDVDAAETRRSNAVPLSMGRMQIKGDEKWNQEQHKVTFVGGPRDGEIEWTDSASTRMVCYVGDKDAHYKRTNAHTFEFDGWHEPKGFDPNARKTIDG